MLEENERAASVLRFEIRLTSDGNISSYIGSNRSILRLFSPDAQTWFDDTVEKIAPLIIEATENFEEIFIKKTGAELVGSSSNRVPKAEEVLKEGETD